jgi:hypothetical protein
MKKTKTFFAVVIIIIIIIIGVTVGERLANIRF